MEFVMSIATFLFSMLVLAVGVVSIIAIAILFKHGEKKSVARQIAFVYIILFFFLLLVAFKRVGIF